MKDSYSFDIDQAGLDAAYEKHYQAYCRIFERCGLKYIAVEAHSGAMGGSQSHEFMVASDAGEDFVAICDKLRLSRPIWRRRCRCRRRLPSADPGGRSRARRIPHAGPEDDRRSGRVHRASRDVADEEPGDGGGRQARAGAAARRSSAQRDEVRDRSRARRSSGRRIRDEIREWFGADAGSLGPVGVKNMRDPRRQGARRAAAT